MSLNCPQCTAPFEEGAKFCKFCGAGISTENGNSNSTRQQDYNLHLDEISNTVYGKASLGDRFVAHLLDSLFIGLLAVPAIFMAILINIGSSYSFGNDIGPGVLMVILVFVPLIYALIKDGLGEGQSWGKRIMKLKVVNIEKHTPCTKGESAIRNLVSGLIGAVPYIGWLIEPVVLITAQDGRKIGDRAARTQVVDANRF